MAINIKRVAIEFLPGIGRIKATAFFFRSYVNKGLYYKANNAYSINKTPIKNNIDTITINSNIENEIYYLVLALLNSSPTKRHKLKALLTLK